MNATLEQQANPASHANGSIKREAVIELVRELGRNNPDPEDYGPIGPFGPFIREAVKRLVQARFGTFPQPWKISFGPRPDPWATGPWPDPWRRFSSQQFPEIESGELHAPGLYAATLSDVFIERAEQMQAFAELLPGNVQNPVQDALSELISRFIDDCGNGRIRSWKMPPRPFPFPPRREDFAERLSPVELVTMGVHFDDAARFTVDGPLQKNLALGGAKLTDAGLAAR